MSKVSATKCPTPRCKDNLEKYGDRYQRVYEIDFAPDYFREATLRCDSCGGYSDGTIWKHVCTTCGKDLQPGELTGLFVPHNCVECQEKIVAREKASGRVCRLCHQVYSNCCC